MVGIPDQPTFSARDKQIWRLQSLGCKVVACAAASLGQTKDHFSQLAKQREFLDQLGLGFSEPIPPSYNVAPPQQIAAVRATQNDKYELVLLRWGLVPGRADDLAIGNRMINARADTVATKPAYRNSFKKRRCLVVADGFYEWQKAGKTKQPYLVRLKGGKPFCFAGLWERWNKGEAPIDTCTIITTDANKLMEPIHDRMPVVIAPGDYDLWLDVAVQESERLTPLLRPYRDAEMEAFPVGTVVNSPKNNSPEYVEPLAS